VIRVHEYVVRRRPAVRDVPSALIVRDRSAPATFSGLLSPVPDHLKASNVFAAVFEETERRKRASSDDNQ
jgi:hypothetical protein